MKPKCKLCGSAHWTYEEHMMKGTEALQKVGASVLRNTVTKRTPVTKPVLSAAAEAAGGGPRLPPPKYSTLQSREKPAILDDGSSAAALSAGRPKKHKTNAERQRAYRERSK